MTLTDQIYAQARILAGPLECRQEALLRMVCLAAERSLQRKMRPGLSPTDCKGDFIAAASLYALAAFTETDGAMDPEVLRVADVTVQKAGASPATNCLRRQAELMIAPYLTCGSFSFRRV